MMDISIVEDLFNFGKYERKGREADENQEPSLYLRDYASNQFTPVVSAEKSPMLSSSSSTSKKVLRLFEQLKRAKKQESIMYSRRSERRSGWMVFLLSIFLRVRSFAIRIHIRRQVVRSTDAGHSLMLHEQTNR
jgi:hypothetical protein